MYFIRSLLKLLGFLNFLRFLLLLYFQNQQLQFQPKTGFLQLRAPAIARSRANAEIENSLMVEAYEEVRTAFRKLKP